jgi:hypothetical protein
MGELRRRLVILASLTVVERLEVSTIESAVSGAEKAW